MWLMLDATDRLRRSAEIEEKEEKKKASQASFV